MKNKYFNTGLTFVLFVIMISTAVALWRGIIPIDWLASLGYEGIFFVSLINGIAPVGGPSQIATFFVASKLNPLAVGLAAGIGGAIGELAGYAFGYFFRSAQTANIELKIQRIANWRFLRVSQERSFIPLFVLASIPNPFFDPVSAIAGSLRIGFVRYFIPVLLGKIVRHLAIAYAGYYMIDMNIELIFSYPLMVAFIDSGLFVVIVFCIALVAWLVRSVFESEPDPFLLSFTFFAFAGQCILTAEMLRGILTAEAVVVGQQEVIVLVLFLPAVIFLLLQTFVVRWQVDKTVKHYERLLKSYGIGERSPEEIASWAAVLIRITGVDFFPEFYLEYIKVGSPREKRREQAVSIIPRGKFNVGDDGIVSNALIVPQEDRTLLWRCYALICFLSWAVFVICILVARSHK
jgi:membrane protein YqaA with SNARE-associated domain